MLLLQTISPVKIKRVQGLEAILKEIREYFIKNKIAKKGDKIVVVSGWPFGKTIESNMLLVETL